MDWVGRLCVGVWYKLDRSTVKLLISIVWFEFLLRSHYFQYHQSRICMIGTQHFDDDRRISLPPHTRFGTFEKTYSSLNFASSSFVFIVIFGSTIWNAFEDFPHFKFVNWFSFCWELSKSTRFVHLWHCILKIVLTHCPIRIICQCQN